MGNFSGVYSETSVHLPLCKAATPEFGRKPESLPHCKHLISAASPCLLWLSPTEGSCSLSAVAPKIMQLFRCSPETPGPQRAHRALGPAVKPCGQNSEPALQGSRAGSEGDRAASSDRKKRTQNYV